MKPLALFLMLAGTACSAPQSAPGASAPAPASTNTADIAPENLMRHVSVLAHDSMEGRRMGTPGAARARAYLVRQFREVGLQPIGDSYDVAWTTPLDSGRTAGTNIVGVIRGSREPNRYIVLTGHYDHLGFGRPVNGDSLYNGADDNASGVAAILEIARWLRANPPRHSVIVVAFDGEEGGLRGAVAFVANPPVPLGQIALNINLDMVGRNTRNELYAAGAAPRPFLRPYLDSVVADALPLVLKLGHDRPGVPGEDDWTNQSDQAPFHRAGIPFVYFGEEDHPDYHRPGDHTERLMPEFFARAATAVLRTLLILDRNLQNFPSR